MRPPDFYLTQQLETLERLVAEHPNTPGARTARTLIRRVRSYRSRGYLHTAPRLRRHVLADLRAATRLLERKP